MSSDELYGQPSPGNGSSCLLCQIPRLRKAITEVAAVPNTATLPHQQLQNIIWEDCPRVKVFCFLCSQMVCCLFAFKELQKCLLWHRQLVKPRMRAPTELSIQVTSDSFWWAFLCSSCGDKRSTAHISNQLLSNCWTIPQDSHLPWLQVLLLFDLNEEKISFCSPTLPLPWKSCTVQNLSELLSISALFSQHSYRHVLISTRDVSGLQVHS